jgi:hypothetical protein
MFLLWAFQWWKRANSLSLANPDNRTAAKPVVLEDLRKFLAEADRIIVKDSPEIGAKTLFDSTDKKDLEELRERLTLETPGAGEWFHCMCNGTPALYVYQRGSQRLELTNHHGLSIRCSLWDSDVRIIDTEKWISWFDDRRISGPREEIEAMRGQHAQSKKDWERWLTAMPKAVQPVWSDALGQFGRVDHVPLRIALEQEMPDQGERILALLEWFGSGSGPWSGFPSYEIAAEKLLLDFSTTDIVAAIQSKRLSPAQTEGTARLFGGWTFGKLRPKDLKELPNALKKDLWLHTQNTNDKDKISRARRAFTG